MGDFGQELQFNGMGVIETQDALAVMIMQR